MSWLLAVFVPGLLMLVTFGLQRLESQLNDDCVSATDVANFLERADACDVDTLARDGMPRALDSLHRRLHLPDTALEHVPTSLDRRHLPSGLDLQHQPNPEFQPHRHANRV